MEVANNHDPIRAPLPGTLRKYGLSKTEWRSILALQGNVCAICERVPASGRWVTDHQHIPGWKKLPPARRRIYVRGIICSFCNSHVAGRFVTLVKARNLVTYLEKYHRRLNRELNRA